MTTQALIGQYVAQQRKANEGKSGFRTERVDYSKWLKWDSDELVNNGGDYEWKGFSEARRAYRDLMKERRRGGVEPGVGVVAVR